MRSMTCGKTESIITHWEGMRKWGLSICWVLTIFWVALAATASATINEMYGVNLSGGEFGSGDNFPTAADFDYYHGKGLNLIRLPFLWERVQPTLSGTLNSTELAKIDACVSLATARGMKVILDVHNYGNWNGTAINTGSVTYAAFGNLWQQLASHYNGNTTVYAYGLMNEPNLPIDVWLTASQTAINSIRTVDTGHTISVAWWKGPAQSANTDPNNNLIYESHEYFDSNNSGTYTQTYDASGAYPTIGVDRADAFLNWCVVHHAIGFYGEFGVPNNDSRWITVLNNFLTFIKANGFNGTYWSAGHAWGTSYPLSSDPVSGVDSPQMGALQNYTTGTYAGVYSGDVFSYTGSTSTGNLAIGKKAFSSSDFSKTEGRWQGIDGSTSTDWASGNGVPTFLGVDLGQVCNVNKFVITHNGGHPTAAFKIQSSNDGLNFTDLVTVTGNTSAVTTHPITTVAARYFRIYITNAGTDGISRILEFEIDGAGAGASAVLNFSGVIPTAGHIPGDGWWGNPTATYQPLVQTYAGLSGTGYSTLADGANLGVTCNFTSLICDSGSGAGHTGDLPDAYLKGWGNATPYTMTFAEPVTLASFWMEGDYNSTHSGATLQIFALNTDTTPVATLNLADITGLSWTTWTKVTSLASQPIEKIVVNLPNGNFKIDDMTLAVVSSSALPSPWAHSDIGAVGATGSSNYSGGVFTMGGSGSDIQGTADAFQYSYQVASGDCSVVARVATQGNTNAWAKAGVMIRSDLTAGAANMAVMTTPSSGLTFQYRTTAGGTTTPISASGAAPYWVKVTRVGNTFTGYISTSGTTWTQVGTAQTITMGTTVYIGLVDCSHASGTLSTATLDNVTATP